jgi:hypothetical protein
MSITAYFTLLDCFQVLLDDRRIATSDKEKTMAAGAQMWQSEMFTEDQMVVWENRGAMAQTWAALQTYFTEKWLEQKQIQQRHQKKLWFKEAALLAQETAAAKEEGKTQALLFAMLQDHHAKQIMQMEATNKTNMDAMMEWMNALVMVGGVPDILIIRTRWIHLQEAMSSPLALAPKPRNPSRRKPSVPTAKALICTSQPAVLSLKQTRHHVTQDGSLSLPCQQPHDRDWGPHK